MPTEAELQRYAEDIAAEWTADLEETCTVVGYEIADGDFIVTIAGEGWTDTEAFEYAEVCYDIGLGL
jgi:hypothetical protein